MFRKFYLTFKLLRKIHKNYRVQILLAKNFIQNLINLTQQVKSQ